MPVDAAAHVLYSALPKVGSGWLRGLCPCTDPRGLMPTPHGDGLARPDEVPPLL